MQELTALLKMSARIVPTSQFILMEAEHETAHKMSKEQIVNGFGMRLEQTVDTLVQNH